MPPQPKSTHWVAKIVHCLWCTIINARRMRTRVTVLCLSVCVLPIYWLHQRFIQLTEHTNQFRTNIQRFSTKGFLWNASVPELQLHPRAKAAILCYCKARGIKRAHAHIRSWWFYIKPAFASFSTAPDVWVGEEFFLGEFVGLTFCVVFALLI